MLHPRSAIFVSWDDADFMCYVPLLRMIHGGSKCAASLTEAFVVLLQKQQLPNLPTLQLSDSTPGDSWQWLKNQNIMP